MEVELYLYGTISVADCGKIIINSDELGTVSVIIDGQTQYSLEQLLNADGLRVHGHQNISTGQIDTSSIQLIEIIKLRAIDETYLDKKRRLATSTWENINSDKWIDQIRHR